MNTEQSSPQFIEFADGRIFRIGERVAFMSGPNECTGKIIAIDAGIHTSNPAPLCFINPDNPERIHRSEIWKLNPIHTARQLAAYLNDPTNPLRPKDGFYIHCRDHGLPGGSLIKLKDAIGEYK